MNTQTSNTTTIPKWFWIVSAVLLLWNLMGVMAFVQQMMITAEQIALMPADEQALYNEMPIWAMVAFACAVFGGALGCVLLLLKKSIALPVLIISLIAIIIQMFHSLFIINSVAVYGPGAMIMPIMVILVAIYLVFLARSAKAKQWLN
jgi:hypothetical protein